MVILRLASFFWQDADLNKKSGIRGKELLLVCLGEFCGEYLQEIVKAQDVLRLTKNNFYIVNKKYYGESKTGEWVTPHHVYM